MYVIVQGRTFNDEIFENVQHVTFTFPNTARLSREGREDEFIEVGHAISISVMPRG